MKLTQTIDSPSEEVEFKKMKISMDKECQTRDGTPVKVYAVYENQHFPVHGAICEDSTWLPRAWSKEGYYQYKPGHPYDLIEKPKNIEVDCWMNVYPNEGYATHSTKEQADNIGMNTPRIACINIKRTVTEGEGL